MTSIEKAINKASDLLAKREDENEYHLHDVDRKWVIEAMMDYAEYVLSGLSEKPTIQTNSEIPNHIAGKSISKKYEEYQEWLNEVPEISDEEIEKSAREYWKRGQFGFEKPSDTEMAWIKACKWYRNKLKNK